MKGLMDRPEEQGVGVRWRRGAVCAVLLAFSAACVSGRLAGGAGGAGAIPLAAEGAGAAAMLVVQAVVVAAMLALPGLALLRWMGGGRLPQWPAGYVLGMGVVLSLAGVTMGTVLPARALGPEAGRGAFVFLLVLASLWGTPAARELASRIGRERWGAMMALCAAALYLVVSAAMSATPYPAVVQELLDAPNFVRMAANLAERGALAEDYYICALPEGVTGYPSSLAVSPVAATAACFWLFGLNAHSFFVVHAFLGVVMLAAAAALAGSGARAGRPGAAAGALGMLALPAVYGPASWGSIATPLGLMGVLAVGLWPPAAGRGTAGAPCRLARACLVVLVAAMPMTRPEGAFLAAALVGVGLLIACGRRLPDAARPLLWVGMAAMGLVAFAGLVNRSEMVARNPAALYVKYDESSGRFVQAHRSADFYKNHVDALLAGRPMRPLANAELGREILSHPIAYCGYAGLRLGTGLAKIGDELAGSETAGPVVILLVLAVVGLRRDQHAVVLVVLAYLAILGVMNDLAGARHRYVALLLLASLALRTGILGAGRLAERWAAGGARASRYAMPAMRPLIAAAACAAFAVIGLHHARNNYWLRLAAVNQYYAPAVRDLLRVDPRPGVVASNYPSLLGCVTGARSVGGSWLVENLEALAERFRPACILIDDGPLERSFTDFERHPVVPTGYRVAVKDRRQKYVILRREEALAGGGSGEP
jgi:hypothetical protein